jgi:hypothetical protein
LGLLKYFVVTLPGQAWTKLRGAVLAPIFLFGLVPHVISAQPSSPREFISSLQTAIQEKSLEKLNAITYTVGMNDSDKKQAASVQQMFFSNSEIASISIKPLPPDFQSVYIVNGKKWEPTYPPTGVVNIQYKKTDNGPTGLTPTYAIIDGHYFLISTKTTDLGWKGPPDKTLGFAVTGKGQDTAQITVKWNASGVELERKFTQHSNMTFLGQYVEQVDVTSADHGTDVTLTISENGKEIFCSQPLKGKGKIEYKKS